MKKIIEGPCATVARFTQFKGETQPLVEQTLLTSNEQIVAYLLPRGFRVLASFNDEQLFLQQLEAKDQLGSLGLIARLIADGSELNGSLLIDDEKGFNHKINENSPGPIFCIQIKDSLYTFVWGNDYKSMKKSLHFLQAKRPKNIFPHSN